MKSKTHLLVLAAAAVMVVLSSNTASAQGNFDSSEFRQRQLDGYREQITVKAEDDWKKLEPLVAKVMDAQRDVMRFGGFGFGRGGSRRGGGDGNSGGNNRNRSQPIPEREHLQKAMEDKAAPEELKTKLTKFREARHAKEAALEKAQADLRKELSPRQEAGAVLAGLLK